MSLDAVEFLRRFLLHTLPSGFMRIRYYGFLVNRHRAEKLQRARQLLGENSSSTGNEPSQPKSPEPVGELADELELCPKCKQGRLVVIASVGTPLDRTQPPWSFDSS